MKGNLRPRNYLKFPSVKVIVKEMAYKNLKTPKKTIFSQFLRTSNRNPMPENFTNLQHVISIKKIGQNMQQLAWWPKEQISFWRFRAIRFYLLVGEIKRCTIDRSNLKADTPALTSLSVHEHRHFGAKNAQNQLFGKTLVTIFFTEKSNVWFWTFFAPKYRCSCSRREVSAGVWALRLDGAIVQRLISPASK